MMIDVKRNYMAILAVYQFLSAIFVYILII